MDEIETAILNAWRCIAPTLSHAELARRRIRGQRARAHPPRAWCLAIRASDTRLPAITPTTSRLGLFSRNNPQEVALDRATLANLCAPIELTPPGQTLDELCALLGTTPSGLLHARVAGDFKTHYIRGLGGRWGKPRPLLYTDRPLDPSARRFASPDPVWSWTADYLPNRLPADFPDQILRRVPYLASRIPESVYRYANRDSADDARLHPEHPDLDLNLEPRARKSLALPPPPPDYVAYKWKDGQYVGHDWRNPFAAANHARRERTLVKSRQAKRRRRNEKFTPTPTIGSEQFRGWRWLCPRCGKAVNALFLPVPLQRLLEAVSKLPQGDQ